MQKKILLPILVIAFFSCQTGPNKGIDTSKENQQHNIPHNAIPFTYNGYILTSTNFDGVSGNFLVDTGTKEHGIDSLFFSRSGLTYTNFKEYTTTGIGDAKIRVLVIKDSVNLSVGNHNIISSFIPIHKLKPVGGDFIDGLIGTRYFMGKVLEINYPNSYIAIHNSIDSLDVSAYTQLPLVELGYWYGTSLKIKINPEITVEGNFFMDTGLPESTLTYPVAQAHEMLENVNPKVRYYTKYGGLGGESSTYEFIADSLLISDYSLSHVNMAFSLDTSGLLAGKEYLGIIGNDILDRFDWLVDFENRDLYLKPNEKFNQPYVFDRLGFSYVDRGKSLGAWLVTGLTEGSPAEQKGLKIDDRIISVNGVPVTEISHQDQFGYFDNLKRIRLEIESADGKKSLRLKLAPLL